jgi:hypothetical protein
MTTRRVLGAGCMALVLAGAMGCATQPTYPGPTAWPAPQCWESVDPFTVSLYYTGPENTLDNAQIASRGNNCATLIGGGMRTVVRASDLAAANALCQDLKGTNADSLLNQNVDPPADGYRCF